MDLFAQHMTIGSVAQLAGVTPTIVRRADSVLQPERDSSGKRIYNPARVTEWIALRAAARAVRSSAPVADEPAAP